jgi:hypothetical protein
MKLKRTPNDTAFLSSSFADFGEFHAQKKVGFLARIE